MKLFKGVPQSKDDGWFQLSTGNSVIDGDDYCLTTHYLKADEVPEQMCDAKTASEFIAGLLNAYFNKIDATKFSEAEIVKMGVVENEDEHNPNQLDLF